MMHRKGPTAGRTTAALAAILALAALTSGQAQAQANKVLTIVTPAEPPDLEPCHSSRAFQGRVVLQNIAETLTFKDPATNALTPRLATSWEQVDATTWRFKLRPNVKFHDGAPFNAQTLKASLDRSLDKKLPCGNRTKFFANMTLEVTPVDDLTVLLKTDKPSPILPMSMSAMAIGSPNLPPDKPTLQPVGTGPYVMEQWKAGQEIVLKRNDNYWGPKPQADGARYIWREESAVRASMVKIGEADIALNIAPQEATDKGMDYSYLNSESTYLRIDMSRPPLTDKRVRLALNYAMDREGMRGTILSKDAIHATQIVMPSIPGHNHELDKKVRGYDPAMAKKLLAEAKAAGVPVETEITLIGRPTGYTGAAEVMEAFMTMFKAVGLNVTLKNLEPGQYNEIHNKPFAENRGPTLLQGTHDNNFGDPIFSYPSKYSCAGSQSMLCDKSVDDMVEKLEGLTGEARVKAWQEVFRALYEDVVPEVWMYHMVGFVRVGNRIDFKPDVTTNAELRIGEIKFK